MEMEMAGYDLSCKFGIWGGKVIGQFKENL